MRTAGNALLPAVQPWADSAQLQRLAAKKHFVFAPTPLLRWLWSLGLSQTAERLFLVYWEDACTRSSGQYLTARLSVSLAASLIGASEAAVKKANRQLLVAGVIVRSSRQIHNCVSTVADTVITVPHEVMLRLWDAPDRAADTTIDHPADIQMATDVPQTTIPPDEFMPDQSGIQERLDTLRAQLRQMAGGKRLRDALGGSESAAAQMDVIREIDQLERLLSRSAAEQPPKTGVIDPSVQAPEREQPIQVMKPDRSLSTARRQAILSVITQLRGVSAPKQVLSEIVHQVERGVFTELPIPKAINICLNLVRTGRWRTPYGMTTPNYGLGQTSHVRRGQRIRQSSAVPVGAYLN